MPCQPGGASQCSLPRATPETTKDGRSQGARGAAAHPFPTQTPLSLAQAYSCVDTTADWWPGDLGGRRGGELRNKGPRARMRPWAGRVLGQVRDQARGRPPAREAYLFDLLRDIGHSEAIEPGHPWEDIGQDAPVQLEGNLPDNATILLGASEALNLWGAGLGGAGETGSQYLGG